MEEQSEVQNTALESLWGKIQNIQEIHIHLNLLFSFLNSEISRETSYTCLVYKADKHAEN